MIKQITPERAGISSEKVLRLLKNLESYEMPIHSILMSRGDDIYAESYFAPFHDKFLHRMYSVSKSFVAMAVGAAVTEGLFTLDDVIIEHLPEYKNELSDEFQAACTVRDMLMMKSNIGTSVAWWGNFPGRVDAYYSMKTSKVPGTAFYYDSIGSFLLGCMIEKLTGKPFLTYLKEKVLYHIGFSKESYTLTEPGGYTVGDSGVLCTTRDLWLFARFIMKKGEWNGKQYIDRSFMEEAISLQSFNHFETGIKGWGKCGYGYLIWKTHKDGFSLIGMGDQLAICDMKRDLCFVITADNQAGENASRDLIFNEYYKHFLEEVADEALPENGEAYGRLTEYLSSRKLVSQKGEKKTAFTDKVSGVTYAARENRFGIKDLTLRLGEEEGSLTLTFADKTVVFDFALCENKLTKFSYGTRAKADMMGVFVEGAYDAAISGAWVEEHSFMIKAHVIDTYFGAACAFLDFKDDRVSLYLTRSGQYVFDGMTGFVIGEAKKD
ncbi:MAG: serine hydrolase [Clostridia bacterium]|nr:serine hydrolase [Clostridia bacterium]